MPSGEASRPDRPDPLAVPRRERTGVPWRTGAAVQAATAASRRSSLGDARRPVGERCPPASSSSRRSARPSGLCFEWASGWPASSQKETSGWISTIRSSASASASASRMRRRRAKDCCESPLPVSSRAIRFASAKVSASRAARGGVVKTLLPGADEPPGLAVRRPGSALGGSRSGCRPRPPSPRCRRRSASCRAVRARRPAGRVELDRDPPASIPVDARDGEGCFGLLGSPRHGRGLVVQERPLPGQVARELLSGRVSVVTRESVPGHRGRMDAVRVRRLDRGVGFI